MDDSVDFSKEFTTEKFQSICYNRAKSWSKYFEERQAIDPGVEIDINEFDTFFQSDDEELEDDTDDDGFEIRENKRKNKNDESSLFDLSIIEQNITVSDAQSVLAIIAQNTNTTGIDNDDREFLEQTLPLFEKRNRELRETGFEKILNTFDERQIEENMGKIMLRKKQSSLSPYYGNDYHTGHVHFKQKGSSAWNNKSDSDSDSLQSVDTARYIRSSKRDCNLRKRYATKTTIKSYRLVKSKRDELREKYGYLISDEVVAPMCNTSSRCFDRTCLCKHNHSQHYSIDDRNHFSHKTRLIKKHYHRTICDNSISPCSSDEMHYHSKRHVASKTFTVNAHHHRHYSQLEEENLCAQTMCYAHSQCHNCYHPESISTRVQQRFCNPYKHETMPYLRETDCVCKGINKLCDNVNHLANSSIDDWLVENNEIPEKASTSRVKKMQFSQLSISPLNSNLKKMHSVGVPSKSCVKHKKISLNQDNHVDRPGFDNNVVIGKRKKTIKRRLAHPTSKNLNSTVDSETENCSDDSSRNPRKIKKKRNLKTTAKLSAIESKQTNESSKERKLEKSKENVEISKTYPKRAIKNTKSSFQNVLKHEIVTNKDLKSKITKKTLKPKQLSITKKPTKINETKSKSQETVFNTTKHDENNDEETENFFDLELQLAIKASKELYVEELKKRLNVEDNKETQKNKKEKQTTNDDISIKDVTENVVSRKQKNKTLNARKLAFENKNQFTSESIAISLGNEWDESEDDMENKPLAEFKQKLVCDDVKETFPKERVKNGILRSNSKAFSNLEIEENKTQTKHIIANETNANNQMKKKAIKPKNKDTIQSENDCFKMPKSKAIKEHLLKTKEKQIKKSNNSKHNHLKPNVTFQDEVERKINKSASMNNFSSKELRTLHLNGSSMDCLENANVLTVKNSREVSIPSTSISNGFSENTTFFANPSQICNSTALANHTALSRQISTAVTAPASEDNNITATISNEQPIILKNSNSKTLQNDERTDSSDCAIVTSTTESQLLIAKKFKQKSPRPKKTRFILYKPNDTTVSIPEKSLINDRYRVTLEQLAPLIGEREAKQFMRYYRGRREFQLSSSVIYYPPTKGFPLDSDSSDEDDFLARPDVGRLVQEVN